MNNLLRTQTENRIHSFPIGAAYISVYSSKQAMGQAAAAEAAEIIRTAIDKFGLARIVVATGNSQLDLISALTKEQRINWSAVEAFHMDEYVGLPATHPSSFRYWIKERVEDVVHPRMVHYLHGDASDVDAEIKRYSALLCSAPIHLAFVGFGENGHIAFNDPHVADFEDPATIKRVALDEACRKQQAGEGHFSSPEAVPSEAVTVTCSGLFRAEAWVCCVPEQRKAQAVKNAIEGPISTECPASLFRRHRKASIYLDSDSASLLSADSVANH